MLKIMDKDNTKYEEDFSEMEELYNKIPKDSEAFVTHSLSIPEYVYIKLGDRPQKYLADRLSKSEAEVSKLLSGSQNITLRTISKLEAALDINIINPEIIKCVKKHYGVSETPVVKMERNKISLGFTNPVKRGWKGGEIYIPFRNVVYEQNSLDYKAEYNETQEAEA